MMGDRRAPVARYVCFHDDDRQRRFVELAEEAHSGLSRADTWSSEAPLILGDATTVVERRGLFRRAQEVSVEAEPVMATPALAEAHGVAVSVPAAMSAVAGCAEGRRLAALIGGALVELVADFAAIPVLHQRANPAYRQTLRLTAELTALAQVTEQLGCGDPEGCVALCVPEAGGQRKEDAEVSTVQAVLRQLAGADGLGRPPYARGDSSEVTK